MFGDLKNVPLREVWPHEAKDFSPWLAANIRELGAALGMELELSAREAGVGDFSLDLLARDLGSSKTVIIENQLTQTDHDHLGKLLTYAAGFDASVVIWLCAVMREEHRQALDWLNQRTDGDTLFFGVAVEVLQIDDSRPAFHFKVVASPNAWRKSGPRPPPSSRGEQYRSYFQALIDELREEHRFTAATAARPQSWYAFSSGFSGITYGANFAQGGRARAEVYIDRGDRESNKRLFDLLHQESAQIARELGCPLNWERLDERRASRLTLYTEGCIEDSDIELEALRRWHVDCLLRLKRVIGPRLEPALRAL